MRSGLIVVAMCIGFVLVAGFTVAVADSPDSDRVLSKEVIVATPRHDVWRAWTTRDGVCSFFAPEANVELRVGGPYEILFNPDAEPGSRGGEGCRVLSYLPDEMFSFEWNFPPSIPSLRSAGTKTHVVLLFDELPDNQTRVRFAQLGWGEGADWDAGYAYFDKAWSWVLGRLRDRFAPTLTGAGDDPATTESWIDSHVTTTSVGKPEKRQDFVVELPVPVSRAWHAMTTRDGLRSFIAPDPKVDLSVGGAYEVYEGTAAHVLAFVPNEMLAVTGSAPLELPNVRMGSTWAVIHFEATGDSSCRVRMSVAGWQEGDDWDRAFEYFLRNNAGFLNLLYDRFTKGPLEWKQEEGAARPTFTRVPLADDEQLAPAEDAAIQRTDRVFLLDADPASVWCAFTTKEGLSAWAGPVGEVDLTQDGAYEPLSDAGMKGAKVLSYLPQRMLAHGGDALPEGGRAWVVWRFEPVAADVVRVRFTALGKCSPEAWAKSVFADTARMDRLILALKRHLASLPKAEKPADGS